MQNKNMFTYQPKNIDQHRLSLVNIRPKSVSPEQLNSLVTLVKRVLKQQLTWADIADMLNPPTDTDPIIPFKTPEQWKTCWNNLTNRVNRKIKAREANETNFDVTIVEERVSNEFYNYSLVSGVHLNVLNQNGKKTEVTGKQLKRGDSSNSSVQHPAGITVEHSLRTSTDMISPSGQGQFNFPNSLSVTCQRTEISNSQMNQSIPNNSQNNCPQTRKSSSTPRLNKKTPQATPTPEMKRIAEQRRVEIENSPNSSSHPRKRSRKDVIQAEENNSDCDEIQLQMFFASETLTSIAQSLATIANCLERFSSDF